MRFWIAAMALVVAFLPQRPIGIRVTTATGPQLHVSDLTYRVSCAHAGNSIVDVALGAWFDADGDSGNGSILVTGSFVGPSQGLAEYKLVDCYAQTDPGPGSVWADYPTMTNLHGYTDLSVGHYADVSGSTTLTLGGIYKPVGGSSTYLNYYVSYPAGGYTEPSLIKVSSNFSSPAFQAGPYTFTGDAASSRCFTPDANGPGLDANICSTGNWHGANIVPIPSAYQSLLGGDLLVSNSNNSIIGHSSSGPSAGVIHSADIGVTTPVSVKRLYGYVGDAGQGQVATLGCWDQRTCVGTDQYAGGLNGEFPYAPFIINGYATIANFGVGPAPVHNFFYAVSVPDLDGGGNVTPPVAYGVALNGSDAATDNAGTTITLPNLDLSTVTAGNTDQDCIWLSEQSTPITTYWGTPHKATGGIVTKGNSGASNAFVTVNGSLTEFTHNLTAQDYTIGQCTGYDPTGAPSTSHTPHTYPYEPALYLVDMANAVRVINGDINYWEMPVTIEALPLPIHYISVGANEVGYATGAAVVDTIHNKLIVIQKNTDATGHILFVVFDIAAPAPSPSAALVALAHGLEDRHATAPLWPVIGLAAAAIALGPLGRKRYGMYDPSGAR